MRYVVAYLVDGTGEFMANGHGVFGFCYLVRDFGDEDRSVGVFV